jgi:AraC-like DNA-binding protein
MTMIETPDALTQTPPVAGERHHQAALLADVLSHIRLSGALFLRGQFSDACVLESPGSCDLVDLLTPGAERLIVFHALRRGRLWVTANDHRVELNAGDVAVLPHAHRHFMGIGDTDTVVHIETMLPPAPWNDIPYLVMESDGGETAELVCGYFRCDELLFNSFLRRLPPVFAIHPDGRAGALLDAAIDYALEDGSRSGGRTAMGHVTEMLFAETLRLYTAQEQNPTGWLAATADPVVSRALKAMHDDPARDWSADELARHANSSRSVLGERFKALLGQSPIRYLVEWRMQIAAELLRTTALKLAEVAERSGYGSEAAFSRAFHRHLGLSPAQWREGGR